MPTIHFSHPQAFVGTLSIDDGIDDIRWGYNLNTATFPTYGGEVVQILSVFIDDLWMGGTLATYDQVLAVYQYFGRFMQIATQSNVPNPVPGQSSYDLQPMTFTYPHRNWSFQIYPLTAPQFYYGADVIAPTWQLTAHVIDDSPDLDLIKDGIQALVVTQLVNGAVPDQSTGFVGQNSLTGQISPQQGNPDSDPFETYDSNLGNAPALISSMADYYNSLLPSYLQNGLEQIDAGLGSTPALPSSAGATNTPASGGSSVTVKKPKKKLAGVLPGPRVRP